MSHRKPFDSSACPLGAGFHLVSDEEIARDPQATPPPIDFAPLFAAGRQTAAWLLDVARSRTDDPLDLAAIERVARTVEAVASKRCSGGSAATEQDILVVVAILVTAFEIDLGVVDLGDLFGGLYAAADSVGAPLWQMIRAAMARSTSRPASAPMSATVARAPATHPHRPAVRIPVVIRRRPCIAHGADELGDARTVLVIG